MALGNIRVDGDAMDPQPSIFRPHAPQGSNPRGINGMYNPSAPEFGWSFEIGYGSEEITDPESFTAFGVFGAVGEPHDLTYENADGNDVTKIVCLAEEVTAPLRWGTNVERFSVNVYEVAEPSGS